MGPQTHRALHAHEQEEGRPMAASGGQVQPSRSCSARMLKRQDVLHVPAGQGPTADSRPGQPAAAQGEAAPGSSPGGTSTQELVLLVGRSRGGTLEGGGASPSRCAACIATALMMFPVSRLLYLEAPCGVMHWCGSASFSVGVNPEEHCWQLCRHGGHATPCHFCPCTEPAHT